MLTRIGNSNQPLAPSADNVNDTWSRNEADDMQEAIKLLYKFKADLCKLHPACIDLIENALQRPRY